MVRIMGAVLPGCPRAAAAREALEETGLEVTSGQLVGVYHCPRTSEGFGVVNFVFATSVVGGELMTSDAHPEVRWFDRDEIAAMGRQRLLRGTHIELALDDYAAGRRLPEHTIQVVDASPPPEQVRAEDLLIRNYKLDLGAIEIVPADTIFE